MTVTDHALSSVLEDLLGPDLPIAIRAYDGSRLGPPEDQAPATIVVQSPNALRRIVTAPGELGFGRAYVAGDLDVEGDIYEALRLGDAMPRLKLSPKQWTALVKLIGVEGLKPLAPPPEEAHLTGRRHSKERDAAAIRHHYDVSNEFYELVLGPTMTYSCAVFEKPGDALDVAQEQKYELICRKLDLQPGQRLLDVGCGWGGMVMHAAAHHGVRAVGVTISPSQADKARERVAAAGLADRVDIRMLDYRDVVDGPYDAISSIGMFEHVGVAKLGEYFARLRGVVVPGGRVLNHGISRPWSAGLLVASPERSFIDRYVFPDGELHEVGTVVSAMQKHGPRGSARREPPRALRAHVAALGREPRGELGRSGASRGARTGAGLASLHGGVGAQLREGQRPDPPGACRPARCRSRAHAAPS